MLTKDAMTGQSLGSVGVNGAAATPLAYPTNGQPTLVALNPNDDRLKADTNGVAGCSEM